jgi:hypothetical protein
MIRRRKSPLKGDFINIFNELVSIPDIINSENFSLEVLLTREEELRRVDGKGSWRRKGISIVDRNLIDVVDSRRFTAKEDFLIFLPEALNVKFTNKELAKELEVSADKARKATYCLKKMGLIKETGKRRNELVFEICI